MMRPSSAAPVWAVLVLLAAGGALAQSAADLAEALPEVIPPTETRPDQSLEVGAGFGRYDFDAGGTSGFDSQFLRYTRSRPRRDTWRVGVGRQQRLDASSVDFGVGYTRQFGRTAVSAGIATGTGDVLGHEYRFDLGVARPVAGFQLSAGYTRIQSKAENESHGWNVGVTRWLPSLILSAGHRVDYGRPGDTTSATTSLGAIWYRWRAIYVGAGVEFGEVAYQLVGGGTPLGGGALVDYDATGYHVFATRYLDDRSGLTVRYDHGRADDIWRTDGVTVSYFREW